MRFVGEPVAAVIATDPHVAEQAVQLITAEYEELPAVFDEVDALTSKVYVHDELKPAGTFADLKHLKGAKNTNVALDYRLRRGDFDKAYAAAEHKFEHEFKTQKVLHLSFEPFACIADYKDTHVTLYNSSQGPSFVRTEIARLLGWPENKVRIKVPYLGSGYGSKLYIKLEALALALSMIARRPVKVASPSRRCSTRSPGIPARSASRAASTRTARSSRASARCSGTAAPMPTSARASRRSPASRRRAPTTSTTSRSIPTRSTPT